MKKSNEREDLILQNRGIELKRTYSSKEPFFSQQFIYFFKCLLIIENRSEKKGMKKKKTLYCKTVISS